MALGILDNSWANSAKLINLKQNKKKKVLVLNWQSFFIISIVGVTSVTVVG